MMRITDPAEQAWMLERLTLRPWKCMEQPLRMANEAAVRDIPQLSINASWPLNRRLAESANRATTGERVWGVDTGHDLTLRSFAGTVSLSLPKIRASSRTY